MPYVTADRVLALRCSSHETVVHVVVGVAVYVPFITMALFEQMCSNDRGPPARSRGSCGATVPPASLPRRIDRDGTGDGCITPHQPLPAITKRT